ncbi:MAG: DUF488 domain-containing protein [Candidatus Acidiferrales bacterium]
MDKAFYRSLNDVASFRLACALVAKSQFLSRLRLALADFAAFRQNTCGPLSELPMMPTPPSNSSLFTVGHSSLELDEFLQQLITHKVKVVCDVRSRPGSLRFPQFNREPLEACLASAGIQYESLGEVLGGRPADPRAYHPDGLVSYEERRKAADFRAGIDRALELSRASNIALMCAEEDPLQCHRFLMICPALLERGVTPLHIRRGGELESQRDAEDRLLKLNDLAAFDSGSLFVSEREAALKDALRLQAKEFAFRASAEAIEYF